ncbi:MULTISPECIES: hypothetical protein [unclassified Streptomyces]|uniref:hypothetical protein n=1 Tax=unclassified Streptomyces TaxID=2593676 RepID=UPI00371360C2
MDRQLATAVARRPRPACGFALDEHFGFHWSAETAVPFTGRSTGMFAVEGTARFGDFQYHGEGGS